MCIFLNLSKGKELPGILGIGSSQVVLKLSVFQYQRGTDRCFQELAGIQKCLILLHIYSGIFCQNIGSIHIYPVRLYRHTLSSPLFCYHLQISANTRFHELEAEHHRTKNVLMDRLLHWQKDLKFYIQERCKSLGLTLSV